MSGYSYVTTFREGVVAKYRYKQLTRCGLKAYLSPGAKQGTYDLYVLTGQEGFDKVEEVLRLIAALAMVEDAVIHEYTAEVAARLLKEARER